MFTVTIESGFTAKHQLTMPNGRKEPLHGHDWRVWAAVSAEKLDKTSMVIDFDYLKRKIEEITAEFNGAKLEELACFEGVNTSAENVAKYIYGKAGALLDPNVRLEYIEVAEVPLCRAKYSNSVFLL